MKTRGSLNLLFAGDTHGRHRHLIELVQRIGACTIVHLGDLTPDQDLAVELAGIAGQAEFFFIHGNHDCDSEAHYDRVFGSPLASNCLHGTVVEIEGVRIAGLGGNFKGQIWRPPEPPRFTTRAEAIRSLWPRERWRGGLPLRWRSAIFHEDLEKLSRLRADILVTHEAPSTHRHGFEAIDELARAMRVSKLFHGHHHVTYSAVIAGRGGRSIDVHGVGLRGVVNAKAEVLVPGELDEVRRDRWRPR